MEKTTAITEFSDIVKNAIQKINEFEGGNTLFFGRLGKSRSRVTHWKSGAVIPKVEDQIKFIETAEETIKELREKRCNIESDRSQAISRFNNLISCK